MYNAQGTIERALRSVFSQHFESSEIIALDDGSTDSSFSILKDYSKRIRIFQQRNRGAATARNGGAKVATGEYLAFLDADDEWLPGKLLTSVSALDRSPSAVVAYSDVLCSDGRTISAMKGSPSLDYLLSNGTALYPSAAVVRRSAFEQCGGFSEEFGRCDFGEDTFMGLRLREQGELVHIAKPLVLYHVSDSSVTLSKYPKGYRTFTRLVKQRYGIRGRGVILVARRYYASLLIIATLQHIKQNRLSAFTLLNLLKASAICPWYVAEFLFRKSAIAIVGDRAALEKS